MTRPSHETFLFQTIMVISRLRRATDLEERTMSVQCHSLGYARISLEPQRDPPCRLQVSGGARFEVGKASCLSWICLLVLRENREGISFGRNCGEPRKHKKHVECCGAELLLDDRMEHALTS